MSNVNKVILLGRLGANPTVAVSSKGIPYARLRIATGGRTEQTQWHSVVVFGKSAEYAALYGRKGSVVYVEGRIEYRQIKNDKGFNTQQAAILADNIQIQKRYDSQSNDIVTQDNQQAALTNQDYLWNPDEITDG